MKDIIPSLSLKATASDTEFKTYWIRYSLFQMRVTSSIKPKYNNLVLLGFLCPIYIFQKQTSNANDVQNTERLAIEFGIIDSLHHYRSK